MIEKLKKIWQNETLNKFINFFLKATSFDGAYNRLQFLAALIFASMIEGLLKYYAISYLNVIGSFIFLYVALAAIQKRCRDIGTKGTPVILIVSIFLVYLGILHPSGMDLKGIFHPISIVLMILYFSALLYALFYPGNDKKNLELTSPLLKYPRVYFALGVILVLAGRYVVETYYL